MRRRREDSIFNEGLDCGGKMKRLSDFVAGAKGLTLVWFFALTILAACDGSDNGMEAADSRKKSSNSKDNAKSFSSLCEDCEDEAISSSSSAGGWVSSSNLESFDWSIPKENYLNPEITYGTMTDSRDGQTYKTVKIGDQTWMAENLNYETANSFCYEKYASNCSKYGRFYLWSAAMDSAGTWSTNGKGCGYGRTCRVASAGSATLVRGVCPDGWHLPTQTECNTLFTAVGGKSTAGTKLKSTSGWYDNGNGTDAFSFSALPAGNRDDDGSFYYVGNYAYFWSATELNSLDAYGMTLYYNYDEATLFDHGYKDLGSSVRCV